MFANVLIGLREGLEAALIVAILVAYLVKLDQRAALPRLWLGVALAILLAFGTGAVLFLTGSALPDHAEEVFAGSMSVLAAGLITWMVFWMAANARHIRTRLHGEIDRALLGNAWLLTFIAFAAVAREGLETALFLWAGVRAAGDSADALVGALIGLAVAVLLGVLIYRGALRLNLATLFTWTGVGLIVVAAGVLAHGIGDLQAAGVLPLLTSTAFDVSAQIPPEGWLGTLLKGSISFTPDPSALQVVVWTGYVVVALAFYARTVTARSAKGARA